MMPNIEDRESAVMLYMKFKDAIYETDLRVKNHKNEAQRIVSFREAMHERATKCYYKILGDEAITDGAKELFVENIRMLYPNIIVW